MRDHRNLRAFQLADELAFLVYEHTRACPRSEQFGLTSQMRRAGVSIPSNIVEGCARESLADYIRFLDIAYGSARELEYQVTLAHRLGFLSDPSSAVLLRKSEEASKVLNGLLRVLRQRKQLPPASRLTGNAEVQVIAVEAPLNQILSPLPASAPVAGGTVAIPTGTQAQPAITAILTRERHRTEMSTATMGERMHHPVLTNVLVRARERGVSKGARGPSFFSRSDCGGVGNAGLSGKTPGTRVRDHRSGAFSPVKRDGQCGVRPGAPTLRRECRARSGLPQSPDGE